MQRCCVSTLFLGVVAFIGCVLHPELAWAYMDPGTGSYVLQILIATFMGAAFAIKMYWRRIKAFIKRKFGNAPERSGHDDEDRSS
jgi:hypothetical protein